MRRPIVLVLVAVAVVVGGYLAFRPADSSTRSGSGSGRVAAVGVAAPTFSTFDLAGESVRLRDVKGPVLVNFWASWCGPCREEFPMLARVHGKGVTVLGVVFRDSAESARKFMEDQKASWPALLDPQGRIAAAYDIHQRPGIPVTYAIDAAGVIKAKHLGPLTADDLDRLLLEIGAQPPP